MIHTIYKPIQYVKWDGTNFVEILEFTKTYCYAIGDTLYFNSIPLEKGTIIYKDDYCFKISTLDDFNDYIRNYIINIFTTPVTSKLVANPIDVTYPHLVNKGINIPNCPTIPVGIPPFNDVWYGC